MESRYDTFGAGRAQGGGVDLVFGRIFSVGNNVIGYMRSPTKKMNLKCRWIGKDTFANIQKADHWRPLARFLSQNDHGKLFTA